MEQTIIEHWGLWKKYLNVEVPFGFITKSSETEPWLLAKVTEAALRSSAISREMKRLEDKQQHQHWFQESNYNVHNHNVQCW